MSTDTETVTAWLDELDAAHGAAGLGSRVYDHAAVFACYDAVPKLTAALRAVLTLAKELQGTAEITGGKVNGFVFADRIRTAVVGALAQARHEGGAA